MTYSTILYEENQNIAVITLNRPSRMNAVIEEMYDEIGDVLTNIANRKSVRGVIVKGASLEKNGEIKYCFCAGADLKAHKNLSRGHKEKRAYIQKAHEVNRQIYFFNKPVVACINGHARGAGVELALCCDFIIMGKEATIAFPETGLGTFVGGGLTHILPRIVGVAVAKYLVYSGEKIFGDDACKLGVALQSFAIEEVYEKSFDFMLMLTRKAPLSLEYAKKMINRTWDLKYDDASDLEAHAILSCMDTKDWQEGIDSFNEKREPLYKGE